MSIENLSSAHAFDYIVLRVKPGLTSCEDLAMALADFYYIHLCIHSGQFIQTIKGYKPFAIASSHDGEGNKIRVWSPTYTSWLTCLERMNLIKENIMAYTEWLYDSSGTTYVSEGGKEITNYVVANS